MLHLFINSVIFICIKGKGCFLLVNDLIEITHFYSVMNLIARALIIIAIIAAALLIGSKIISGYFTKSLLKRKNANKIVTVEKIVKNIYNIVILFIGSAIFLENILGVDTSSILTVAGVSGLAVGFASQSIIKDFISGIMLLMEDTIAIGDLIEMNGYKGIVEDISLRSICLRDENDILHVIPNNIIKNFSNHSRRTQ